MKAYHYYIKNKDKKRIELYAITNKKEHAKEFKKYRDMNLFKERIFEYDDKYDWKNFANSNMECLLEKNKFLTAKVSKNSKRIITGSAIVLTTKNEYAKSSVSEFGELPFIDECVLSYDWWINWHPSVANLTNKIFKEKIRSALNYLEYYAFRTLIYGDDSDNDEWRDSIPNVDFEVDELSIFIYLYGNLFK